MSKAETNPVVCVTNKCMYWVNSQQDGQCTYKRNTEACSCNHCCSQKAVSIT